VQLLLDLKKCTNWDEKLDSFIGHMPSSELNKRLSIDIKKALCSTIYKHVLAVHEYDVSQKSKIASPVILFKPTVQSVIFAEEDYGLHKVTPMILRKEIYIYIYIYMYARKSF